MAKIFLIVLIVFLVFDAIWLLGISRELYQRAIGFLMPEKVNLFAAMGAYILLAVGLTVFVIAPGIRAGLSVGHIALFGALFGFVAYGIYDFTNLATIKGWPLWISLVDMGWGTLVSGLSTAVTVYLLRFFS
ncbi:MAG: hypothetical protein QG633_90 [Patescibacteria group bacterium]|jgi:uncharacterized membrane protein|nr:hypothetical protein [Patescibacteria group bacterium]